MAQHVYDEYKKALIDGINRKKGTDYVNNDYIIDDLEQIYADEIGDDKLLDLQIFFGVKD